MKRRLSAVLLALGLTVSALSMGVYAEETEAMATEQVTEATTDAAAEVEADLEKLESEAAEAESEEAQTEAPSMEEQLKYGMTQTLTAVSGYTDEQLEQMMESDNASAAAIAMNWNSVKDELGAFVEITDIEVELPEDGKSMTIISHAKYDNVDDKTDVVVTYKADQKTQGESINWEINYTMGKKMEQAGLNTLMGLGIVFLTLLFLSFLIAQMHFIPDIIEKRAKKNAPAAAPAPAAVPAPAAAVEEEDLTDDLELVAVITAAIAASENTSSDGFVVRSIRKANKRNWQKA